MHDRGSRAGFWALIASVLVHVVALAVMAFREHEQPPIPSRAVTVPIRWLEPVAIATPTASPVRPRPVTKTAKASPTAAPKVSEPAAVPEASKPVASAAATGSTLHFADHPLARTPSLTPSPTVMLKLPGGADDAEPPHGATIRNGPDERVDEVALHDYQGEKLSRSIGTDLTRDAARARMNNGNVAPFFRRLEGSLRDRADAVTHTPLTGSQVAKEVLHALAPDISPEAAKRVSDTALGRSIINNNVGSPSADDQRFRESALQSMAFGEAVKLRVGEPKLRTVLELVQDPRGTLADIRVVERSGDAVFDDSALHLSQIVVRELPENDEKGLGTSWWCSRWQFTWEPPSVRVKLMEAWPLPPPTKE